MFKRVVIFLFLIICVSKQTNCAQLLQVAPAIDVNDKALQNYALATSGVLSTGVLATKILNKSMTGYNVFNTFILAMAVCALLRNLKVFKCNSHDRCAQKHLNPRIFIAVCCFFNLLITRQAFLSNDDLDLDFYSSCTMFGLMALSGFRDRLRDCEPPSVQNSPV